MVFAKGVSYEKGNGTFGPLAVLAGFNVSLNLLELDDPIYENTMPLGFRGVRLQLNLLQSISHV